MKIFHCRQNSYSPHQDKLVLQCHLCSGLMIGYSCFNHHSEGCNTAFEVNECWKPENYRPLLQQDGSISFLAKGIDCNKCKKQQMMSTFPTNSEKAFALRIMKWARLVFLLVVRKHWEKIIKLTGKHSFVDPEMLNIVLSYLT